MEFEIKMETRVWFEVDFGGDGKKEGKGVDGVLALYKV